MMQKLPNSLYSGHASYVCSAVYIFIEKKCISKVPNLQFLLEYHKKALVIMLGKIVSVKNQHSRKSDLKNLSRQERLLFFFALPIFMFPTWVG